MDLMKMLDELEEIVHVSVEDPRRRREAEEIIARVRDEVQELEIERDNAMPMPATSNWWGRRGW